jgi:ketosteroid isomerase-like protein
MTAKETVQALYAAYAMGDPDRIAALLHADVIWVAPAGNAWDGLADGPALDASYRDGPAPGTRDKRTEHPNDPIHRRRHDDHRHLNRRRR